MFTPTFLAALAFSGAFTTVSETASINDPIEFGRLTIADAAAASSGGLHVVGSLTYDDITPPYSAHYTGGNITNMYDWFGTAYNSSLNFTGSSLYGDYPTAYSDPVDPDYGQTVCVDSNGVSYVGGNTVVTVSLDPVNYLTVVKASGLSYPTGKSGSNIYNYQASGSIVDVTSGGGYVYALGNADGDYFIAKLNPSGMSTAVWTRTINDSASTTPVQIVYIDEVVYVLGTSGGEFFLAKISDNGSTSSLDWTYTYDGVQEGPLAAKQMKVATISGTDNIFICGTENTLSTGTDIRTIRVSDAGSSASLSWAKKWDGSYTMHTSNDSAAGIVLDSSNNVFVAGTGHGSGGTKTTPLNYDYIALQIPLNGASQTMTNYEFGSGNAELATSIGIDSNNRIHIFGTTSSGGTAILGTVFYSYSSGFSNLGSFTKSGSGTGTLGVTSVVHPDDSVMVVGQSLNSDGVKTGLIVKYDWS